MTDRQFTQEQEDVISDIALATALHISNTVSKHRIRKYAKGALVGFVILFAGVGAAFHEGSKAGTDSRNAIVRSGSVIAVAGCNRDFKSIKQLRDIIAKGAVQLKAYEKDGTISAAQYQRGLHEIRKQLHAYPLPDCRKSDDILTSNPDRVLDEPTPLHP